MRTLARMLLVFLALAAIPSYGLAAGMVTSVEGMTSTVMQKGQSSFSGIGLRLRVHPPQLMEEVTLMPTLEYWRNTSNIQAFGIETTRKDATLGVDARFDIPAKSWKPYIGAGFGLHFISSEVDAPSLGLNNASSSLIKGGVTVLGGLSFGLAGRLGNLIEVKYHHVPDHSQLKINWGLSYSL